MSESSYDDPSIVQEEHDRTLESFIPIQSMEHLVHAALKGRFDHDGRLLPLEVQRTSLSRPGYTMYPLESVWRNDIVVPLRDNETIDENGERILIEYKVNLEESVITALTQRADIHLTEEDVEKLKRDKAELEAVVTNSNQYTAIISTDQDNAAFHIEKNASEADTHDMAGSTRVYVPSGKDAMRVTKRMIELGTQLDAAKLWLPPFQEGDHEFRNDTPIFIARTSTELKSIILNLRLLSANGELGKIDTDRPTVGMPINGVTGAYLGQSAPGTSFNGTIEDLFVPAIRVAAAEFGRQNPISAGEKPSDEWFKNIALLSRDIAQKKAPLLGIHPSNHALLKEQNAAVIEQIAA